MRPRGGGSRRSAATTAHVHPWGGGRSIRLRHGHLLRPPGARTYDFAMRLRPVIIPVSRPVVRRRVGALVAAPLLLVAAACAPTEDADDSAKDTSSEAGETESGTSASDPATCAKDAVREPGTLTIAHRLPGVRAVVHRQRPHHREGLRVRGGLRGRRAARLRRRTRSPGSRCRSTTPTSRGPRIRLRHQPDLRHPGALRARRLLQRLLLRRRRP